MKIIEALKELEISLQKTANEHSGNISGIAEGFERGFKVGTQRGLQQAMCGIVKIIMEHSCQRCGKLIENDADSFDGLCEQCHKDNMNVHS